MFPSHFRLHALVVSVVLLGLPEARAATTLVVAVRTADGHPLSGAVLTVQELGTAGHPGAPQHAVMDQVNRAFTPDLLIIPVGSTVQFPNSDSVSHQIYSFSPARRFQLPLYRGKPYPPVHFDQVGIVTLGCNIHDSMLAYIVVTDAPFFGRTDATGSWSVDVPRGSYRVTVWHPRMREDAQLTRDTTLGEGERAEVTLQLGKALQPAPLSTARHSWDAY